MIKSAQWAKATLSIAVPRKRFAGSHRHDDRPLIGSRMGIDAYRAITVCPSGLQNGGDQPMVLPSRSVSEFLNAMAERVICHQQYSRWGNTVSLLESTDPKEEHGNAVRRRRIAHLRWFESFILHNCKQSVIATERVTEGRYIRLPINRRALLAAGVLHLRRPARRQQSAIFIDDDVEHCIRGFGVPLERQHHKNGTCPRLLNG
jgi:hypothetical protein